MPEESLPPHYRVEASVAPAPSPGQAIRSRDRSFGHRASNASKNDVFGRREENAGAAGLRPDTMINAVGLGPVVVAWVKLLVVNHQLAVKKMQFFNSGMAVRRIIGSRREPYHHAYTGFFGTCRKLFAGYARHHFFPFRFCPQLYRWRDH